MPPKGSRKVVPMEVDENDAPDSAKSSSKENLKKGKAVAVKKEPAKKQTTMTNEELKEYHLADYSDLLEKAIINVKGQKTVIKKLLTDYEDVVEKCETVLLRRALWTATFIAVPEGRKLVVRAFKKIGITGVMNLMKKCILAGASSATCAHYGEMIILGWKQALKDEDDELRLAIEDDLLTATAHAAIVVEDPFGKKFQQILSTIAAEKKEKARMDPAIYRSFLGVLWRHLYVPNSLVRFNASMVMLDFFPIVCSDPDDNIDLLKRQYDAMASMLKDSYTPLRQEACKKILRIIATFWNFIERKKEFLSIICDQLARDADIGTRLAVYEGMRAMLPEPQAMNATEFALKVISTNGINDRNERVRIAAFGLLRKLRGNRFIKYFEVVPMDEIMARFEIEPSEEVRKEIVPLIFRSFFPTSDDQNLRMDRVAMLVKSGRIAALTFHRLLHQLNLVTVKEAVTHIKNISIVVAKSAKLGFSSTNNIVLDGTMDTVFDETLTGGENEFPLPDEKNPNWVRNKVMVECIVVMSMSLRKVLMEAEYDQERAHLDKLQTGIFKRMFKYFRGTSLLGTTMVLGSMLPPNSLDGIAQTVLKLLNEKVVDESIMEPYLEATAQWKIEYLLQIIGDGLQVLQSCTYIEPIPKKSKKSEKTILTPLDALRKSLVYLKYLMRNYSTSQRLTYSHVMELEEFYQKLSQVRQVVDHRLSNDLVLSIPDEMIVDAFKVKQTLAAILLNCVDSVDEHEVAGLRFVREAVEDLNWFNKDVEPRIKNLIDDDRLDFVVSLSEAVLLHMSLFLRSWDFSVVPSISQAPSILQRNDSEASTACSLDFIYTAVQTVISFCSRSTPARLITPVLNAAKTLLTTDETQFADIVKIIEFLPVWIIERHSEEDEINERNVADAFLSLWKALQANNSYTDILLSRHLQMIAAQLVAYVVDANAEKHDLEDPRILGFEIPLPVSLIIHNVVFKLPHCERIARSLIATIGGIFCKGDGISEDLDADECLMRLGSFVQVSYMCDFKAHTAKKAGKNIAENLSEEAQQLVDLLSTNVKTVEKRERRPVTDHLVLSQVKELF